LHRHELRCASHGVSQQATPRQKFTYRELQWLRRAACDMYAASRSAPGNKKNESVQQGHQVPLVECAVKGYNKPAVHCSQMAVILEAAAAVQQDSNSKKWRLHGKIIGSKTATINRLSKAEWCQHWLSPHKETATMTCKVKPSKKANNQPARLCLSMPAWAVATTNRKKSKGNNQLTIDQWGQSQQRQGNKDATACRCADGVGFSYANLQHGKAKWQQLTGSKNATINQAAAARQQ